MNIEARAAKDALRITTNSSTGAGTSVTFVKPDNSLSKVVKAITTKHMLKTDENGFKSIAKTATIVVHEQALLNAGYPTRTAKNEISLLGHKVSWTDITSITWWYTVRQNRPDEKIGLIVLILDDYETPITPARIVIGWTECRIDILLAASPDPAHTQTLDNGDVIPLEYDIALDGTFTVPYLNTIAGMNVLPPFLLNNDSYQQRFDDGHGRFTFTFGALSVGDLITIKAMVPIWSA